MKSSSKTHKAPINRLFFAFIYVCLVLGRIFSFLTIVQWPIITWIYIYILDVVDYGAAIRGGFTFRQYEYIDKITDFITRLYLVYAGYVIGGPYWILVVMVAIRLIGDIGLAITKDRKYLFLFPNLVEFFFPLYLLYLKQFNHNTTILVAFILISAVLKILNEYLLHVKNWIDPFNKQYVKTHKEHKRS